MLYRRYSDREALLLDALADAILPIIDGHGPIREQLMRYARDIHAYFTCPEGIASLRIHLEAAQFPELYRAYRDRVVDPNFEINIAALDAAKRSGDLRKSADGVSILEAIGGGVLIHALYSQHAGAPRAASPLSKEGLESTLTNSSPLPLRTLRCNSRNPRNVTR